MSLHLKPWEMANYGITPGSPPYVPNTNASPSDNRLYSSAIPYPGSAGGGGINISEHTPVPPLPPRPGQQAAPSTSYNRGMYNPYLGPPPNYSYNGYYNPYGPSYSPYGYGSPRPNMMGNNQRPFINEPSFSQLAEESSAGAFQSIESFVNAFGSISAMLESTFQAIVSSFRAVVGVADHLGRVKQLFSALAIFRFLRWCYRRILYLIGISKIKPEQIESLWESVSQEDGMDWAENVLKPRRKPSSWPILVFLGFIFAGPYLMWKLLASLRINSYTPSDTKWASGETEHFVAVTDFDFESAVSERELKFKKGQRLRLAPATQQPDVRGWVLASDGIRIGLVPTNYIKILGKRIGNIGRPLISNSNLNLASSPVAVDSSSDTSVRALSTTPIHKSQVYTNSTKTKAKSNMTSSSSSISDTETLKADSRSSSTSSLFVPVSPSQNGPSKVQSEPALNKIDR